MAQKFLLCLFACLLAAVTSQAVDYPDWTDEYVNDFASVISQPDTERIRRLLEKTEREAGVEITVVTIASLAEYDAGTSLRKMQQACSMHGESVTGNAVTE